MRVKKLLSTLTLPVLLGIAALPGAAQGAEAPIVVPHAPAAHSIDPHPIGQSLSPSPASVNPDAVAPPVVTPPGTPEPVASTCPHGACTRPDGGGGSTNGGKNNKGGSTGGGSSDDLPTDQGHPSPGHETDRELMPDPVVTLFLCPLYRGLYDHQVELAEGNIGAGMDPSDFTQGFIDTMAFYAQMTRLYCMSTRLDL